MGFWPTPNILGFPFNSLHGRWGALITTFSPSQLTGLAAWYDASDATAMTVDSAIPPRVSLLHDKSGNSGTICFVSGGAASNTATTPTKSITGSLTITANITAYDYTPSADHTLFSKLSGNDGIEFLLLTTGVLRLRIGDGASVTNVDSTVATGISDRVNCTVAVTWTDGVGAAFTVNGSALGTSVAAVKTLTNAAATATIGTSFNGIIYRVQVGAVYDFNPSVAARGATTVADGVSGTWTINTSGATGARISGARDLYQGTVANQPRYLLHSGTNYGYIIGGSGNYFSSPDSATADITGDIDIYACIALVDWTHVAQNQTVIAKWTTTGNQRSYALLVNATTGYLSLLISTLGSDTVTTNSSVAPTVSDGGTLWIRATRKQSDGVVTFYTSTDAATSSSPTWVQLGSTGIAAAGTAIYASTATLGVGANTDGTANLLEGWVYRAVIKNGIAGTVAVDFSPSSYSSGATFTSSGAGGEVWTVNGKVSLVNATEIMFDGINDYLKTIGYAHTYPASNYYIGRQNSWVVNNAVFIDGNSSTERNTLFQRTASPQVNIFQGSAVGNQNNQYAVHARGVVTFIANNSSSVLRVNSNANTETGTAIGTQNPNGTTVGCQNDATNPNNLGMNEFVIYSGAHAAADQTTLINYAGTRWGFTP